MPSRPHRASVKSFLDAPGDAVALGVTVVMGVIVGVIFGSYVGVTVGGDVGGFAGVIVFLGVFIALVIGVIAYVDGVLVDASRKTPAAAYRSYSQALSRSGPAQAARHHPGAPGLALCLMSRLMPPTAGQRWLTEAGSCLFEIAPHRRAAVRRNFLQTAPRVIAAAWAAQLTRRAPASSDRMPPRRHDDHDAAD